MNTPNENDPIEKLLREQENYIADDGFTARVMQSLPARQHPWLRKTVLFGAAVIGSVLAVLWLPWNNLPALNPSVLLTLDAQVLASWLPVLAVVFALSRTFITALEQED